MIADPAAQLRLLDLQAADTALAQLSHRRQHLPELAAIGETDKQLDGLSGDLLDAETLVSDLADEQRRLETEIDAVRARESRDEQRMAAGGLPSKELEGLQHEVQTLKRRQGNLEDELLEVMEKREGADSALAQLSQARATLDAQRAELVTRRDAELATIAAAAQGQTAERVLVVESLPADLVALYEKARGQAGATGAAVLRQRRCEGCRIELSGSELSAVRTATPETVVRCENCRRILVRTAESGL